MKYIARKMLICSFAFALVLMTFGGCEKKPSYESVYYDYMERALEDVQSAQDKYVYFRTERLRELAFSTKWELFSCEIDKWEQLNERLWAVTVSVCNSYSQEPYKCVNFVGEIDGDYKVILGILNIPEELRTGIDFSKYLCMDEDYLGEVRSIGAEKDTPYEQLYFDYMELSLEDTEAAVLKYRYMSEEEEKLFLESKWELYSYEIHSWEQLSEKLWVALVTAHTSYEEEPYDFYNYVGIVDGEYRVIGGLLFMPEDLKEGVDFTKYIGEGGIDGLD